MDLEDDMHDANDVDSYEEDYYSGDARYNDDEDDARYEFLHNDYDDYDAVLVSRIAVTNYKRSKRSRNTQDSRRRHRATPERLKALQLVATRVVFSDRWRRGVIATRKIKEK
ncbi:hypothetical protein L1987_02616 [Smallanthus sonchifolius]|uniref:Uncharacterized protein n=1 Tax=Smallanthus sonchifolius TaxID=185202 RepID=A0ACB9K8J8_9ASTR|nr:hypothetical protein L1987_02616 [Smallanthus sonchifolius]